MSIRPVLFPNPSSRGTRKGLLPKKNGKRSCLCLPPSVVSATYPTSLRALVEPNPSFPSPCTLSCARGDMVARRAPGKTIRNRHLSLSTNTTQTASGRRKLPIGSTDCVYQEIKRIGTAPRRSETACPLVRRHLAPAALQTPSLSHRGGLS